MIGRGHVRRHLACRAQRLVIALLTVFLPATSASALSPATVGGGAGGGLIWAEVQFSSPPSSGESDDSGCRWRPAQTYDAGIGETGDITREIGGVMQRLYERSCGGSTELIWVSQPTTGQLGAAARDVLIGRLPPPEPGTAPPPDRAIVRSGIWFWTDPVAWRSVSVTAWVPTPGGVLWARTTATPVNLVMVPGDGSSPAVSCPGPGRVWTRADGDEAVSPCTVTYFHDSSLAPFGRHRALVGIDWSISWTASTGDSGALPGCRTVAAVPMTVSEIQALVTESRR